MDKKEILSYVLIILFVVLIRSFVVTPIRVNGDSMYNTLQDGNLMILKKYDKSYDRFNIVVVNYEKEKIIKRIIGMPKEDIEYKEGNLYINDELVEEHYGYGNTDNFKDYCGENEYFVMGDNRENSKDSRMIGCVNEKDILGTTDLRFYPFNKVGIIK